LNGENPNFILGYCFFFKKKIKLFFSVNHNNEPYIVSLNKTVDTAESLKNHSSPHLILNLIKRMAIKFKMFYTIPFIIGITLTSFLLTSCGIFGSDDSFSVEIDPNFECTNSQSGTWSYLGIPGEIILSIAINPLNAGHILVGTSANFSDGTQGKIYMSTDCGENWEQVWEGGTIHEIHFDPKSPNVVYANPNGMIRSTDWGKSWSDRSNGLTEYLSFTSSVNTFAIDPEQPRRLYAGTAGQGAGLIFYTDNAGVRWELIPAHQQDGPGDEILKDAVAFIETDPVNAGHVYVGNGPIMRSTNRGVTWELLRETDTNIIYTMAFSSDHSKIFAMNTW